MPARVKHRNWHAPLLLVFAALLVIFVGISLYLGTRSPPDAVVPADLPFELGK